MESFAVEGITMNDTSANPIFVALLFMLRCLVPLAILFGVSYLLRKLGLVAVEAPEPPDEREDGNEEVAEAAVTPPQETAGENHAPPTSDPNQTPTVEKPKES
jgi:hypothetical protein